MSGPPERHRRWELTGAGIDSLALVERETPRPAPDELLVRIDACGICFSDIKILNLGADHPRLRGRDLRAEPVVMGHEAAMTVVAAGEDLRTRFAPGQRYLIQADVYHGGQGMAFGYRLPGGYSQYQTIGRPVLEGDEGCYLLPVSSRLGHAQAALCEPWACVEASYAYRPRRRPRPDGAALLVLLEFDEIEELADELRHLQRVVTLMPGHHPWLRDPEQAASGAAELRERCPEGFDDILCYGQPNPELARHLASLLREGGVFALQERGSTGPVPLDIGSIHYRNQWYTGAPGGDVYRWGRSTELMPGGVAWFIGAGGPLGHMHLERALSLPHPPRKILATQRGGPRLQALVERFAPRAAAAGVEFLALDARAPQEEIDAAVRRESGGTGCDDIVVIIPDAAVVERAYDLLAPGGGLNLFAGVAVGTTARLDLGRIASEGIRLWGTSGSSIADLRRVLERAEAGTLATDRVVAAVGGLRAVRDGLECVREGRYPGKTVIYPQCVDLPLTAVAELAGRDAAFREQLDEAGCWTPAAEALLLERYGSGGKGI